MAISVAYPIDHTLQPVSFIVHHAGAAEHFSAFAKRLLEAGYPVDFWATGIALKKLTDWGFEVKHPFTLDQLTSEGLHQLAETISKACAQTFVFTDVGHSFDLVLHRVFRSNRLMSMPYYENPEPFVPGGYSEMFGKVMDFAERVGLGNSNLAEQPLYSAPGQQIFFDEQVMRYGIGYYPVGDAEKIALSRVENQARVRAEFLVSQGLVEQGQKILAYLGGNNEEYFNEAFPAFLSFVAGALDQIDLSKLIIIFQPHPGAIALNRDGQKLTEWMEAHGGHPHAPKFIKYLPENVLDMADALAYHQKSTTPIYALAGIPAFQTGKETYSDIPVKLGVFPSITTSEHFVNYVQALKEGSAKVPNEEDKAAIFKAIGYKPDWFDHLKAIIDELGILIKVR